MRILTLMSHHLPESMGRRESEIRHSCWPLISVRRFLRTLRAPHSSTYTRSSALSRLLRIKDFASSFLLCLRTSYCKATSNPLYRESARRESLATQLLDKAESGAGELEGMKRSSSSMSLEYVICVPNHRKSRTAQDRTSRVILLLQFHLAPTT